MTSLLIVKLAATDMLAIIVTAAAMTALGDTIVEDTPLWYTLPALLICELIIALICCTVLIWAS